MRWLCWRHAPKYVCVGVCDVNRFVNKYKKKERKKESCVKSSVSRDEIHCVAFSNVVNMHVTLIIRVRDKLDRALLGVIFQMGVKV